MGEHKCEVIDLPYCGRMFTKGMEMLAFTFHPKSLKIVAASTPGYFGRHINALSLELLSQGYTMGDITNELQSN